MLRLCQFVGVVLLFFFGLVKGDCSDPLVCYLNSISFPLPDVCSTLSNGKDLCIKEIVCGGIELSRISSNYLPPTSLGIGVYQAGAGCAAKTKYGKIPGEVAISLTDTSLEANLFVRKENEFPKAVRFSYCNVSSIEVGLEFNDPILQAMAGEISAILEGTVKRGLCPAINTLLVRNVSDFITQKLDPALSEIIASQPSPYPQYGNRYLDWNSSVVTKMHNAVDMIRGLSNLPDFLRCMIKSNENILIQSLNSVLQLLPWDASFPNSLQIYADGETTLTVDSVSFSGIDSIDNLEVFEPIQDSKVVLRTNVQFDQLALNVTVHLKSEKIIDGQTSIYEETSQLSLTLSDIAVQLDLVVAVDEHLLSSLYMDQLSNSGCWGTPITELSISNMLVAVNFETVHYRQIAGSAGELESDIADLVNNVFLFLLNPSGFNKLVSEVVTGAFQGPVRREINNRWAAFLLQLHGQNPCLYHYPYSDETDLVDWRTSKLIRVVNGLVNQYLGAAGMNQVFTCLTGGSGSVTIESKFVSLTVGGLNSFYDFTLLAPPQSDDLLYQLETSIGLGVCDGALCSPLTVTLAGSKSLLDDISKTLSTSLARSLAGFRMTVSLSNLLLYIDSFMTFDFNAFRDLQKQQLSQTGCFASTLQNVSMQNASISVSDAHLTISTVTDGVKAQRNITKGLTALLSFLTRSQKLERHNNRMASLIQSAGVTCANGGVKPSADTDSIDTGAASNDGFFGDLSWKYELFILCVACTLCLAGLAMAYNYWGSSNNGKRYWRCLDYGVAVLDNDDEDESEGASSRASGEDGDAQRSWRRLWRQWNCRETLFFHRGIPIWIRYAVPLVILVNFSLFLQSNLDPKAVSVMVAVTTGDTTHDIGSIFDFGLSGTVHDMWDAGVYPLSILIAFFSGAWPYVKLTAMFCAWMLPPGLMSLERRESVLVVLDALGKWSLVDFFVMVLMLCAFYFELVVYPNVMVVNVTVKPKWGFYCFLLATVVSLGIGHTILACHRLVTEPKLPQLPAELDLSESLASTHYELSVVDLDKQEELELLAAIAAAETDDEDEGDDQNDIDNSADNGDDQRYDAPTSSKMQRNVIQSPLGVGAQSLTNSSSAEAMMTTQPRNTANIRRRKVSSKQRSSTGVLVRSTSTKATSSYKSSLNATKANASEASSLSAGHSSSNVVFPAALKHFVIRITTTGRFCIALVCIASIFCLLPGVALKTMGFHFEGLTGYMLKSANHADYSYISVGNVLPEHSGAPNDFAVRWLQACYFLFGVAMPLAFLLSCLVMWLVPLTLRRQRQLHVLAEVFNAWSTLDVFCVSIVAALLEIQQFAAFIVGDSCDQINKALAQPALDERLDGDDKCFDVQAYVKEASWVLFLVAALIIIVGTPSLAACHATIKRRLHEVDLLAKELGLSNHDAIDKALLDHQQQHKHEQQQQQPYVHDSMDKRFAVSSIHNNSNNNNNSNNSSSSAAASLQSVASDLSRPLLAVDLDVVDPVSAAIATNMRHEQRSSRDFAIDDEEDVVVDKVDRMRVERRRERESRALQQLQRHRERHRVARFLRAVCNWQFIGMSSLRTLAGLGLLTIERVAVPWSQLSPQLQQHQQHQRSMTMTDKSAFVEENTRLLAASHDAAGAEEAFTNLVGDASLSSPALTYSSIYRSPSSSVAGENAALQATLGLSRPTDLSPATLQC